MNSLMPNNVWIFLPLLLYGIAVLLALCVCYFVAPQNKRKRWIHSQGALQVANRAPIFPRCRHVLLGWRSIAMDGSQVADG
jgi:hypothetical protein